MNPLVDYWLKANLFLLLFYGCYALLLRRHTFLALNRLYLMGSLALALVLPQVHIPGLTFPWPWETDEPVYASIQADTLTIVGPATETKAPLLPDWPVLAVWLFALVAAGLLVRTGWRMYALLRLIRQWPAHRYSDYTLVLPDTTQIPTFSFFRYLVLNPADAQTEAIRQHELVHIRQKHSLDVLVLEVVHALCWLNPALLGYRQALRQVHEYLADRDATLQTPTHREAYARFLVSYAFHIPTDGLAHSFGAHRPDSPTLKQRIQMLYQQHTRRRALWKYALVFPLVIALLAMTNKPDLELTEKRPELTAIAVDTAPIVHVRGMVRDRRGVYPAIIPLPGANIVVRNGHKGTTTDAKGLYSIDVPAGTELVVSFVGFNSESFTVPSNTKNFVVSSSLKPQAVDGTTMPMTAPITSQTVPAASRSRSNEDEVFTVVEQNPTYPGGMNALSQFLQDNLRYPEEARQKRIQGKVFVSFIVNTDGAIDRIRVIKRLGAGFDEEAVRVVSIMPNWIPGKQNGRPVAVQYNLPIAFTLSGKAQVNQSPSSDRRAEGSTSTSTIKVTGNTGTSPLYLLDGEEITKEQMEAIDTKTIQSINVLKDAAATSVYGEKGRNGVVQITTKKASQPEKKKD